MKRICRLIIIMSILLTGCTSYSDKKETVSQSIDRNIDASEDNQMNITSEVTTKSLNLEMMLPVQVGYGWYYYGSVDYKRRETIVEVKEENGVKSIMVKGEVDNESIGMNRDLSFAKTYKIMNDGILLRHEQRTGSVEYYLLKEPLAVGTTWEHPWYEESMARSEICEVEDNKIVVKTHRIDDVGKEPYRLKGSEITIEPGRGIVKEKLILIEDTELYIGLDSYGQGIFNWLGYYVLENEDAREGYMTIYKMNDKELAFDIYVKTGEGYENQVGLQKVGKIEDEKAVFEEEIALGNGSKETYTVRAIIEKIEGNMQVTTEQISPEYNGSAIKMDGMYKKDN